MSIEEIARFAKIKGLNLVGTGDFTHPKWLKEIQEENRFRSEAFQKIWVNRNFPICLLTSPR